ncbi:hypothetical protein C9374_002496 [Naegleria lovaniensis]|uniref:MMS19 nucleotide excision repair protein n=1 Tax=Naegleria lovaniensis TaxID=51637 RepID=A0AA88GQ01_NAELO|nr:uncharacterized protein C9374_002496 [Naegleria lovaniensis]KAG2386752.1 hypothetical protein C9374_002496 [Naegleria lovaniensis]
MQSSTNTAAMIEPGSIILSEIASLIDTFCNPDIPSSKKEGAKRLLIDHVQGGRLSINDGIKLLGEYLNHATDEKIRGSAYAILHLILENVPDQNMDNQDDHQTKLVTTLLRFITDRLYDFDCLATLVPCLFVCFNRWPNLISLEQCTHIVLQFFENVNVQSIASASGVQSATKTRAMCFEWFSLLIDKFPSIVKSVNFLNGFIQSIEGERDPANLITCFDMVPRIIELFDMQSENTEKILTGISDDLFDVTSCYFPITYTPPPNDTRGITRSDISNKLLKCFACNKYFAPSLFPFLLEKLSSDLIETKIEALEYMCYCIEQYGPSVVEEYLTEIWAYIKAEAIKTSSIDVMKKCYEFITRTTRVVVLPNDSRIKQFDVPNIEAIVRTALVELRSKECKFAAQYARMLYACGVASSDISVIVFNRVFPELITILNESETYDKIYGTFLMMTQVLQALAEAFTVSHLNNIPQHIVQLIGQAQTLFISMYEEQFNKDDKEMILVIIELISRFAVFRIESSLLKDVYVNRILLKSYGEDHKSFTLLHAKSLEEYKDRSVKDISWIYKYAPDIIQKDVIIPLIQVLYSCQNRSEIINRILSVISQIGTVCPTLTPFITEQLFERISFNLTQQNMNKENEKTKILETISGLDVTLIEDSQKMKYIRKLIELSEMEEEISNNNNNNNINNEMMTDEEPLEAEMDDQFGSSCGAGCGHDHSHPHRGEMSHICLLLNRALPFEQQQQILDEILQRNIGLRLSGHSIKKFTSVFSALIVSCHPQVNTTSIVEMAGNLLSLSLQNLHPMGVTSFLSQAIASLLNKLPLESNEFKYLTSLCNTLVLEPISQVLNGIAIPTDHILALDRYLEVLSWILKGLVMRGAYVYADAYSNILCSCLVFEFPQQHFSSKLNKKAADCFLTAIGEDENSLHRDNHAIVQVLYKQRFFAMNVRKLMDSITTTSHQPHIIGSILLALSNLIHNVPTQVILSEVKNIFPIVLKFLEMRPSLAQDEAHTKN